jgi:hypothetical protein
MNAHREVDPGSKLVTTVRDRMAIGSIFHGDFAGVSSALCSAA